MSTQPEIVIPFRDLTLADVPRVGGKNASLGELTRYLVPLGVRVPDGFAVTAQAFVRHLREAGLDDQIYPALERLDIRDVEALAREGRRIRALIRSAELPEDVALAVRTAYRALSADYEERETDVAVRSSATAEDLPTASFAGQQETYLNVRGEHALLSAVRDCMASLFTDRAIVYRTERGFAHRGVALSVGVQKMVRSDLGSAGVAFTLDTETGFRDVVLITGAWGLGETVVQGRVDPDEFWVHKPTLLQGHRSIIRRERGEKACELVYASGGTSSVVERSVPRARRLGLVLSDDELLQLARWAVRIEQHYRQTAGRDLAMDLEWAKDGRDGRLYIVQARPETVFSQKEAGAKLEFFRMLSKGKLLARGKSVGASIASGRARVIHSPDELASFQAGEVLVAPMTDPDWEPVMQRASAIVTDHGGRTCHAAIVSRELGLPCVIGTGDASSLIDTGRELTVSCAEGDEGKVYDGRIPFEREQIDPAALPRPSTPVMLNVGNPETAFLVAQLPSAGVGLARIEFIISGAIGIHPLALLYPERVDRSVNLIIRQRIAGSASPSEFFIERLASGVAQIGAAFYPRPVIVRFSDFKTNEYAGLLGGQAFEPSEHNPMIGWRGASRYYDPGYREGFALECEALRRVRDVMGLTNVKVMIPFCRTLEEGRRVLAEMASHGLVRGQNGLEVYVMAEIPNNVILADQFADLFDGFSIGSNDLTQLTLGVDRDSERLAHIFDERDPGVKELIRLVIERAHAKGRKVGLCGQAPSDDPQLARFLAQAGIDSISVTSDALPKVIQALCAPEPTAAIERVPPAPLVAWAQP